MSGVAFIDLDGVVADSSKRFEQATLDGKVNWQLALNGEHVHLDTLIDNAAQYLLAIERQGYEVIFLTSRPEHMRPATEQWLYAHELLNSERGLEMKGPGAQFIKTVKWKIDRLDILADDLNAIEVLLVDDEPAILQELVGRAASVSYKIRVYSSLEQVV